MSTFWRYSLIVICSLLIVAGGYFGHQLYESYNTPVAKAIEAISPQSSLFIELNDPQNAITKLTEETAFWTELKSIEEFDAVDRQIKSVSSELFSHPYLSEVLSKNKIYISLVMVDSNSFDLVYIVELPSNGEALSILNAVKDINGEKSIVMKKKYNDAQINMVNVSESEELFNYSVFKGLFIGSYNQALIEKTLQQINLGKAIYSDRSFERIQLTAGKNVDANIYINYTEISGLLSTLFGKKLLRQLAKLPEFAKWSEIDLLLYDEEILFNGYTVANTSGNQFLNAFQQEPQIITIPEILPSDIVLMLHLGFDNFNEYIQKTSQINDAIDDNQDLNSKISNLNKKYGIRLETQFLSWIGNEVAFAQCGTNSENCLVVVKSNDIKKASLELKKLSTKVDQQASKGQFGDYEIGQLKIPSIFKSVFGPLFPETKNNFFIAFKDYIVFAEDVKHLHNLINGYYLKKTLAENSNYQSFSNNISDRSNIYFYCNIRNSLDIIKTNFNSSILDNINDNLPVIKNFEGLALQYSYINEMFYTNIYVKYNPSYQEVNPSSWEVELESNIIGKPYFIENHKNGKLNIIAFDKLGSMYLIDHVGQVKWKIPLIESPMSPIYVVDAYQNNKFQYLFNTRNYIYLIDINGNYVGNHPVKMRTGSTCPITIFDYDNNEEYRLLIALDDNKIYNYNIEGKMIEGWNKVQSISTVTRPAEYLVFDNKDYIFINDDVGNVLCVNRRGEERIKLKKKFKKAKHSNFYINETNSKGEFITTDHKGKLIYLTLEGKISKTDFGNFSEEHFFLYDDFSGNGSKDFIFIDKDQLMVFDRFKRKIFSHVFIELISIKPKFFSGKDNQNILGVVSDKEGKVYFFDKGGLAYSDLSITGDTEFTIGSLNNDEHINFVIGKSKKIKNYIIE